MISVNDLRIGNIVSYNGYVYRISALSKDFPFLDTDEFGFNIITYNNIHGVELTPEILEKCGAVDGVFNIYNKLTLEFDFGNDFWLCKEDEILVIFENIKHLHQLQNLYFFLTGKELNTQP